MPGRGMVVGNFDGQTIQVHAWEVASGRLRPVTASTTGTFEGWIAPDGSALYWLADERGNELGHLVRAPFQGGAVQDVTPELGSYTLRGVGFSRSGNRLALNPIDAGQVLLCQYHCGIQGLHLYDLASGELRGLDLPAGTCNLPETAGPHFSSGDTVIALYQDSSRPPPAVGHVSPPPMARRCRPGWACPTATAPSRRSSTSTADRTGSRQTPSTPSRRPGSTRASRG